MRPLRPIAANRPTRVVEYTYDYLDRRIQRKIDADGSGGGAADFYYNVYQGDNAALEIHDQNGLAASGTGETAPHRQHRYMYGQAVDEILASEDTAAAGNATGAVLWGLGDHEGTIRDIVNNSGAVVDHRKFDSFGKMTSESVPATDFIFGYTGQALDRTTGLYDYWHRWYDPTPGRFPSEDPAAADANLYRYVGNNPLNATDPSGLCGYGSDSGYRGAGILADPWYSPSVTAAPLSGLSGYDQVARTWADMSTAEQSDAVVDYLRGQSNAAAPTAGPGMMNSEEAFHAGYISQQQADRLMNRGMMAVPSQGPSAYSNSMTNEKFRSER